MKKYSNIKEAFDPNETAIIRSKNQIITTKGEIVKVNKIIRNYIEKLSSIIIYLSSN